jgi:hypothetical protein
MGAFTDIVPGMNSMPANVDAVLASGSIALLKPYTSEMLQRVLGETLATRSG